jgi:hypothetical protein
VKHTPGRWYLVPLPNGDVGIKADGHGFISVIRHNSPNEDRNSEQVENARLIAAAPDLLAACRIALPHIEKSTGDILMIEVLRSAIAKATAPRLDKEGNTDE